MMRLSRWLSLLTTRNSISPFRSSSTAGLSGKGMRWTPCSSSGGSVEDFFTLLLSDGVFGSSVAFLFSSFAGPMVVGGSWWRVY